MRHRKRSKHAKQTMAMAIALIGALALLIVLACSRVFIIRDIMVVGNRSLLSEEVITQSGVSTGDNLLSISTQQLRENLERNRYIEYRSHSFDYKGRLTITINERLGRAVVNVLGLYYVLDESGMVLECAGSAYPAGVAGPYVVGLSIPSNAQVIVGETLPVRDRSQLDAMEQVIAGLDSVGMLATASELSVKNLDNLYYTTSAGVKVELGNLSSLHTKLLIAREVLALREADEGVTGAKIDVSSGTSAHYIPAVLPTVTPVPTATPTVNPSRSPGA